MLKRFKSDISIIRVPNAAAITIVIHGGQWRPVARAHSHGYKPHK